MVQMDINLFIDRHVSWAIKQWSYDIYNIKKNLPCFILYPVQVQTKMIMLRGKEIIAVA